MKLTIITYKEPVHIFGQLHATPIYKDTETRGVYIDEEEVPPALAKIILLGLDVAREQYLDLIEEAMKQEGHRIGKI